MDRLKAIQVLEALASGYSPVTGELLEHESVLNERDVIRALQFAIDRLKDQRELSVSTVEIPEAEIIRVKELFDEIEKNPTPTRFTLFFCGSGKILESRVVAHDLFGKYSKLYSESQLKGFFTRYMMEHDLIKKPVVAPYRQIDFFQTATFNNLSAAAIGQLKSKINELGVLKTENLSEGVVYARVKYPRAYESWSESELDLLRTAIKFTNDLSLLSECFQRGKNSIEAMGQKLIYESQPSKTD
jgi:hypothetical protein